MYREVLDAIDPVQAIGNGLIIDCTLGEGGHSGMILSSFPSVRVIACERDAQILGIAKNRLAPYGERISFVNDNFSHLEQNLSSYEGRVSAVLYDFGISSFHFDASGRGFTFSKDEKLDMRLDDTGAQSARDIINGYSEDNLVRIFSTYGEERFSKRIARRIVEQRSSSPIETTGELAKLILDSVPAQFRVNAIHPATRVFQALRIAVNSELEAIEESLAYSWKLLAKGGRIIAISFHSLEDRIAKHTMKNLERGCDCVRNDLCNCVRVPKVKILTKKPVSPRDDEIAQNRRARSAHMRICERV